MRGESGGVASLRLPKASNPCQNRSMRLSNNELRSRAAAFARDWATAHYEKGETQSFWNAFFQIFEIDRKRVAV